MTFTVKYRAGDGKMHEKCIEAASRCECVAKCKAQGIAPISVKEGGKVSYAKVQKRGESKLSSKFIWIIAGIIAYIDCKWRCVYPFFQTVAEDSGSGCGLLWSVGRSEFGEKPWCVCFFPS